MSWLKNLFGSSGGRSKPGRVAGEIDRQQLRRPRTPAHLSSLPRFHGTASDQTHGSSDTPLDRARVRLREAFTPSRPVVRAQMFAGRAQVLKTLIRSIEDQHLHVIIYGDRGIGKTSLLHVLAQLARDARYIVRYASCGEETEFGPFFRAIAQDIPLLYHADFEPTSAAIEEGKSLADLLPEGQPTVPQISDLFSKLSNTRVIVILDEFDRAHSASFRRSVAELMKNLSDNSVRVQFVIAGVATNLTELIEHIPSIRRNILGLQVPNMSAPEIEELIQNGERVSGLTFEREAGQLVSAVAHGSPYIASLLSQHASIETVERGSTVVVKEDVHMAIEHALDEIQNRVSATSRHRVALVRDRGQLQELGLVARLALSEGGRVEPGQVRDLLKDNADPDGFLAMLEKDDQLIAPIADDPVAAYRFNEEGVPVYLWMLLVYQLVQSRNWDGESIDRLVPAS